MKKMAVGSFKVHCLAVMDKVQAKRETVLIAKHGKPVVKPVCRPSNRYAVNVQRSRPASGTWLQPHASPS